MLLDNYNLVQDKINIACEKYGRIPSEVRLLAVSKTKPESMIEELLSKGVRSFGENYVKEAVNKKDFFSSHTIKPDFELIGPLQSNKSKLAVSTFSLIQSVESTKLANELNKYAEKINKTQNILIQVNISNEPQKSGVVEEELESLVSNILSLKSLNLKGLMMIGSFTEDNEVKETEFIKLKSLKDKLESKFSIMLPELSMGMSDDYELAIKCGSTIVRVGSAIFGTR